MIEATYRGAGLLPPPRERQIVVGSPFVAAIATGIAAGIRWLDAHRETHLPLFGAQLTSDERARGMVGAARTIVDRVVADRIEEPEPWVETVVSDVVDAVTRATAGPPGHWLPAAIRAPARPVVALHDAPAVAAADGDLGSVPRGLLDRALVEVRAAGEIEPWRFPRANRRMVTAAVARSLGRTKSDGPAPEMPTLSEFLVCTWHEWWNRQPEARPDLAAVVAGARRHGVRGIHIRRWKPVEELYERCGPVYLHAAFWIVSERPVEAFCDGRGELHRFGGPAVRWRDGMTINAICGSEVARRIVDGRIRPNDIHQEPNLELRRIMIDLYEQGDRGRYLRDSGAEVIDRDVDPLGGPRRLLRLELPGEAYVVVEVTNSTTEPDGTHKRYTLRVPPTMTTCHDAVAWTFGIEPVAYAPQIET